jgi:hypothetical protein
MGHDSASCGLSRFDEMKGTISVVGDSLPLVRARPISVPALSLLTTSAHMCDRYSEACIKKTEPRNRILGIKTYAIRAVHEEDHRAGPVMFGCAAGLA